MAINTNPPRNEYTATAGQTEFDFNFKIFANTDIEVYQTPSGQTPDDTNDLLTLTTDYTVSINGDDGGTVILLTGAGNGDKITLVRNLPITRETDYQQGGDILAATTNNEEEYQFYLIQQNLSSQNRFIVLPTSVQGLSTTLPTPTGDAYFKWSADGTFIENDTTIPDNLTLSETYKDAAQAAQLAAETAQANTEQILDNFDDKYLGSKTSDPTLDNDGNALIDGALYFNTTLNVMKVYDLGTTTWLTIPQIYLSTLQDVTLTSVATGDILTWDGVKWINNTLFNLLDINGLTEKVTPIDNDVLVIEDSADSFNKKKLSFQNLKDNIGVLGTWNSNKYAHFQDQKTNGTAGGSSASGTQIRDLNAIITNNGGFASLSSNQISILEGGDYYIEASAPAFRPLRHKVIIYNASDSSNLLVGTSESSDTTTNSQSRGFVSGIVTLPSAKTLELRHYISDARASNGLGLETNNGDIEIYSDIKIWKVS